MKGKERKQRHSGIQAFRHSLRRKGSQVNSTILQGSKEGFSKEGLACNNSLLGPDLFPWLAPTKTQNSMANAQSLSPADQEEYIMTASLHGHAPSPSTAFQNSMLQKQSPRYHPSATPPQFHPIYSLVQRTDSYLTWDSVRLPI